MGSRKSPVRFALFILSMVAALPWAARAVMDDSTLCPGTGEDCVVDHKVAVLDPDGVIDITHPQPPGSPPLKLHITAGGEIAANPLIALTIKAGAITVDHGGAITGNVQAAKGNTLTILASGPVTMNGKIEASALRLNGTGGDGGSISLTSTGPCQVGGRMFAKGSRSTSIGGSGGDVSLDCFTLYLNSGSIIDASASGPGGTGGNVSMNTSSGALNLLKGSSIRAFGSASDGGSVSLATDPIDTTDCNISGKILLDAKTLNSSEGGAGGSIDVSCGGDVDFNAGATVSLNGLEGGGSVDLFAGGNLSMGNGAVIRANASDASGGDIEAIAGSDATLGGRIETRSGGVFGNDGSISVTTVGSLVVAKGAVFNVSAKRKDQQTGQITLAAGVSDGEVSPLLTVEKGALMKANGYSAGLGALDIDMSGSICTVGGTIRSSAQANDGAAIGFECDSLALESSSLIRATSKASIASIGSAAGGSLTINTTAEEGGTPGSCALGGKVVLKSASTVTKGTVIAGRGGTLTATCGTTLSVADRAVLDVGASGPQSVGGEVAFSANQPVHVAGIIKAKAGGAFSAGGRIAIAAPDVYFDPLPGAIDVAAESAGTIEVTGTDGTLGAGVVSIGKPLNAKGSAFGGSVVVRGCNVTLGQKGWLDADGPKAGGVNEIRGQDLITINGKMTAVNGQNRLFFSTTPTLTGSTIKPTASFSATLSPCP